MKEYTLYLIPGKKDGGYVVHVPALPGCIAEGSTVEEAIANARSAIATWLAMAEQRAEPTAEGKASTRMNSAAA